MINNGYDHLKITVAHFFVYILFSKITGCNLLISGIPLQHSSINVYMIQSLVVEICAACILLQGKSAWNVI